MDGVVSFLLGAFVLLTLVLIGALAHRLLLIPATLMAYLVKRSFPMSEEREQQLANSLAAGLLAAGVFALQVFRPE